MSSRLSSFHAVREANRLRAWQLFQEGWSRTHIAHALGVTLSAVSQWITKARTHGAEALRAHPAPGKAPRLTDAQLTELTTLLTQGAEAHGFAGAVWTAPRVAVLIARTFGIQYSARHVRRLLHARLHWSPQQPCRHAAKRNAAAVEQWRTETYPALKKMPQRAPHPLAAG